MNRIDKLILKAREIARPGLELVVAIIEQNGDSWTAQAHLSDGTGKHPPTIQRATYATLEAAVEHIRAMSSIPTAGTCRSSSTIWAGDPVAKRLKMSNSRDVRRTVNRIANMLLNGDLDPKTANAILYACNTISQ